MAVSGLLLRLLVGSSPAVVAFAVVAWVVWVGLLVGWWWRGRSVCACAGVCVVGASVRACVRARVLVCVRACLHARLLALWRVCARVRACVCLGAAGVIQISDSGRS